MTGRSVLAAILEGVSAALLTFVGVVLVFFVLFGTVGLWSIGALWALGWL